MKICVELPTHLRVLANAPRTITLDVQKPATQRTLLDAVESAFPMLCGTIRDRATAKRRPLVRFFAAGDDRSHDDPDAPLPECVVSGKEPFIILGAIAGG